MRRTLGLTFLAASMIGNPAGAFDIEPTVTEIELPADAGGVTVTLRNPRAVELPVTLEIVERAINLDGTEDTTPADEDFLIFPPQAVLAPDSSQAFRIQWLGGDLTESRSFTLFAAEVPVDLTGAQSGVQTILRIGASIHVTPASAEADPVLAGAEDVDGGVAVTLRNDGQRYVYVDELSLEFSDLTIEGFDLANVAGRTLIPPGASRRFVVPEAAGEPSLNWAE